MVAPNSRPVHPCYLSVFEGSAGSEYSTWAHIASSKNPDLVTAQASTLSVYSVEDSTGKLLLTHTFRNLAGNVCFLETLPGNNGGQDALLIGFSGTPRLSIVTIKSSAPKLLLATTLLDLGPALTQNAYGAVTPLEQDLTASLLLQPKSNSATVAIVLGGGIAVACLSLKYHENSWRVTSEEPYVLPLSALSSKSLDNSKNDAPSNKDLNSQSIVTGFGDILSTTFLPGYLEPTLVMLHSHSQVGRTSSGRLGRQEGAGGTRYSLMVTAVTVTVTHKRSAFLWSTEVPADALHVYRGPQGCLVQCANSIVTIHNTGQVQQCLAVNGWVRSGLSLGLQNIVEANPWPLPKLAISFDGAQFAFVNDTTAFVVLRGGQVYLLQHTANAWSLLPLYISVGAIGQVANLICWPLGNINLLHSKLFDGSKRPVGTNMEMGLLFVGSRLGDSSLLGYALEDTSIADALKNDPGLKAKIDEPGLVNDEVDDYDRILQMEEEALYAPTVDQDDEIVNIIPLSDDEDTKQQQERKRARLSQLKVVRSLTVLDSLTALGPLGPGCNGPISKFLDSGNKSSRAKDAPSMGSTGYIFPCGYGSSGGVGILTAPGRDDRTILAEEDCVNGKAIFSLPSLGIVLLSTAEDGTRFLKLDTTSEVHSMVEINLKEWAKGETLNLLLDTQVLAAYEINAESFALLVVSESSEQNLVYSLVLLGDGSEGLSIQRSATLSVAEGLSINTVTPFTKLELNAFTFGYTLSSGDARFVSVDTSGSLHEFHLRPQIPMDLEGKSEEEQYYSFGNIVALDIFKAPKTFFVSTPLNASEDTSPSGKASVTEQAEYLLDEDDKELYAETARAEAGNLEHEPSPQSEVSVDCEESLYFGLCRQSGLLEIYLVCDLVPGKDADPVWTSFGCGHGVPQLRCTQLEGSAYRAPRMHKIHACEIRFFFCGPSTPQWSSSFKGPRPFCLAIETTAGDTCLYSALVNNQTMALESFDRVPLKSVSRPSQEQYKHFAKLRRKGIVSKTDSEEPQRGFSYNRLFRFKNLSGQDGLFAAVARPIWLIAERGQPIMLCHRSRHAAPAGARPRPVSGFCTGFLVSRKLVL